MSFMAEGSQPHYVIGMYAIITGCGRFGAGLAKVLAEKGHDVVVVDTGADLRLVGNGFDGLVLDGSPIDSEILMQAGIQKADILIAGTADDKKNILSVQLALERFRIPAAIARVSDPALASFYRKLGYMTFCPTSTIINQVISAIQGESFSSLAGTIDPDVVPMTIPESWAGSKLGRINPGKGRKVIGVISRGTVLGFKSKHLLARGDTVLLRKEAAR